MRSILQAISATALVLITGWLAYMLAFERERAVEIVLLEVSGSVDRTRASGPRMPARAGEALLASDRLAVGEEGHAVLGVGEDTRLRLEPESSIEVVEVDRGGVRIELEDGRVQARVRSGSPMLTVGSRNRSVQATDGDFNVGIDGEALAVDVERGTVTVQTGDGSTEIAAGHGLVHAPGHAPLLADADAELLLDVAWPPVPATRDDRIRLTGQTGPHARVRVLGGLEPVEARADATGRFDIEIQLLEGRNALQVEARSPLGEELAVAGEIRRDSQPPSAVGIEVSYGRP